MSEGEVYGPTEVSWTGEMVRLTWPGFGHSLRSVRACTEEDWDEAIEVEWFRETSWVDHGHGHWVFSGQNAQGASVTLDVIQGEPRDEEADGDG